MDDKAAIQNRNRVKKHLEQKLNDGFKRISCFIPEAVYQRLQEIKQDTGQTTSQLIEALVMGKRGDVIKASNVNDSSFPCKENVLIHEEDPEKHKETSPVLDFSEYDLQNLSIDDRDRIVLKLHALYPKQKHAQLRIDFLHENGVLFNGNPWTKKQFSDQLSRARERMKARGTY
ncbi:MAG: hypothetical protein HQK62_07510 [Desulfamplus sp.]|nr:hypothetical protein [Desulfamplus sp.]